jgi:signal transduction histidine kinase
MDAPAGEELLLASIGRANQSLGRINATLRKQALAADRLRTAARALSAARFGSEGRLLALQTLDDDDASQRRNDMLALARRIEGKGLGAPGQLIPISADGSDVACVVLARNEDSNGMMIDPGDQRLELLVPSWAAALTAGEQVEAARHLSEQLAEANRMLAETQERLAQSRALATIGEVAAGAAHEMNNPLTIISGRAQLLASQIHDGQLRSMAEQIVAQSSRLTDMISALRALAEPPKPRRRSVDLAQLLTEAIAQCSARKGDKKTSIKLIVPPGLPQAHLDPEHLSDAVRELVRNALEAEGSAKVEVRAQISAFDDRLLIQVTDDGSGLSEHARAHAFDPFFSEKPAGRQPGLGLSHARRLIEGHGGHLTLENVMNVGKKSGAQATISLPHWRRGDQR